MEGLFQGRLISDNNDLDYLGLTPGNVNGTNIDNDFDGFTVDTSMTGSTDLNGGQTSFTIRMNTPPSTGENVVINFGVTDNNAAWVSFGSTTTFTAGNWFIPKTVTLTGLNDGFIKAFSDPRNLYQVTYTVTTNVPEYQGITIPELDVLVVFNLSVFLDFVLNLPEEYLALDEESGGGTSATGAMNPLFFIVVPPVLALLRRRRRAL